MINNFRNIGKAVLERNGYYNLEDGMEKRIMLLFYQSLIPRVKRDKKTEKRVLDGRPICINFNLENDTLEFKLYDVELTGDNREKLLAFKLAAPSGKKKFLVNNNIDQFYSLTFPEAIEYITKQFSSNKKIKSWFEGSVDRNYTKFLEDIYKKFYIETEFKVKKGNKKISIPHLNFNKLVANQLNIFKMLKEEFYDKDKKETINDIYNRLINKVMFNINSKSSELIPSVSLITFNDKTIYDYDKERYKNSYLNMCYFDLIEKYYLEASKKERKCHICNTEANVISNIPLPMKFYGTTNNLNFENLSSSNSYKSFSICDDCLKEVLTGMKVVEGHLGDYMFGLQTFIIPKSTINEKFQYNIYKRVLRLLSISKSTYKEEVTKIKTILLNSNRKNLNFDLLFYNHPAGSQQFDILKLISNIEMNNFLTKLELFEKYNDYYKLNLIPDNYGTKCLIFANLRYYLFPSILSQNKNPEFDVYGKNLLNFIETFLNNNNFNYYDLMHKFIRIYRKRLHRDKIDYLAPFKMNLILTIFYELQQLELGGIMNKGNCVSEVLNEDYKHFFDNHSVIYEDNAYRQGLFLLGTIISKINYAQKDKSSNFLKKMNMEGMPVRRILQFVNQVKDFANIYKNKIYNEPGIWGNIMDRLQGIDSSPMKPDEVIFYVLSGISFSDYLGMKAGMENKINEVKGEKDVK